MGSKADNCQIFWGEIAPCEHILQIYENDEAYFDALTRFVAEGLHADEGVIVLATSKHLNMLEQRLAAKGIDIQGARLRHQYVAADANEILAKFMVNGWPDKDLFVVTVSELLNRAKGAGRRVRAFGELVAVLWEHGHNGATVNLEHLWHELIQKHGFPLYCAYPKSGFTKDATESIQEICAAHSVILDGKLLKKSINVQPADIIPAAAS